MSVLVTRAIAAAGLDGWLSRRLREESGDEDREILERACRELDLLVLGALADRVRARENGPFVRLHLDRPPASCELLALDPAETGHELMRRVARARLEGPARRPVRVDAEVVGLPIAQVALAFGADELVTPLRGLRLEVYGEGEQAVLRERELSALVRGAGREPIVVQWRNGVPIERPVDESSAARRRFRAPGRDGRLVDQELNREGEA
jgi:hypothetical protein